MNKAKKSYMNRRVQTHRIRFWTIHRGSWVKLTLKTDGSAINVCYRWDNGEGWSGNESEYKIRIVHGRRCIIDQWHHWGNDCDGRHEENGSRYCSVYRLRECEANQDWINYGKQSPGMKAMREDAYKFNGRPIEYPRFEKLGKTVVYDQFAQAMGY